MTVNAVLRVLIPCRTFDANLLKTLVSLSMQTIGTPRLEVALLRRSKRPLPAGELHPLCAVLGLRDVEEVDAVHLSLAQALNLGAAGGEAATLVLAPMGTQFGKDFLSACLEAMTAAEAEAAFCGHTAGYADLTPNIRRRPFRPERLARANAVGPAALVRRAAWERLGGLRPGLRLFLWDFWLRLLMSGGTIAEVRKMLAICPPAQRLPPRAEGQAKAMLVVRTPGAFEPEVCRWAMALLRGESWAGPFIPGRIPGPRDVTAMFSRSDARPRPLLAACE